MAAKNKNSCILNIHTSASMIPFSCPIDLARWLSGDEEPCAQQDLKKITKSGWFESLILLRVLNGHTSEWMELTSPIWYHTYHFYKGWGKDIPISFSYLFTLFIQHHKYFFSLFFSFWVTAFSSQLSLQLKTIWIYSHLRSFPCMSH